MKVVPPQERPQSAENVFPSPEALAFLDAIDRDETDGVSCWRSPDVERRTGSQIEGQGLFPVNKIPANTLIAIKQGRILDSRQVKAYASIIQGSHQQIDRNYFIAGLTPQEVDRNLIGYNHSCDPNARIILFEGIPLAFLVTNQDISPDDKNEGEITVNYSLTQASDTHRLDICRCGAPNCRRFVAPLWDWEEATFQQEHAGEFAWFIEEMIEDRNRGNKEITDVHSTFAPAKLAALLRLTDDTIDDLLAKKEELFAEHIPGRLFQLIFRGKFERIYEETPAHKELQEFEAFRLQFATYFCAFGLSTEQRQRLGVDVSFVDVLKSPDFAGDKAVQQQIEEHLPELVELARQQDRKLNP